MKTLNEYIAESLLDDEDLVMNDGVRSIVKSFIDTYYDVDTYTISKKANKDGKYEVSAGTVSVKVKKKDITNLTNDMFVWDNVDNFSCTDCKELVSLEGAPRMANKFYCKLCNSLTNLVGAPKEVDSFDCSYCRKLVSLKGAPKEAKTFACKKCGGKFTEMDILKVCKVIRLIV
jgi:hypothetical protein